MPKASRSFPDKKAFPPPNLQSASRDPASAYSHWKRCERKTKYRSEAQAQMQVDFYGREGVRALTIYKCPDCGYFHIGHRS